VRYLRGWLPTDARARIVDLGCGSGRLLALFRAQGFPDVIGVDRSPEQIELARQRGAQAFLEDMMPFLNRFDGELDLVTALDVIEHLGKSEVLPFVDACHRALRPGGRLVLQTPNADSPWGAALRYGDFTHETCFTPHALGRLLRLSGFDRIEAREQGPVVRGPASAVRFLLWRIIRAGLVLWNLAETGSAGSGVHTRVFLISGIRPSGA
jgi:SAM-dependent methyltransferase